MKLYNESTAGMAVAPHAQAAESAAKVLANGGNAIEACVTMAATLSAVYPHMTGLGGDSFWLIHEPGSPVRAIHGSGRTAAGVDCTQYTNQGLNEIPYRGGSAAITVAGTLSGWKNALNISADEWGGQLPLSSLLEDAISYCRDGYIVTDSQAQATESKLDQLINQPGFADVFLNNGQVPQSGTKMTQSALAGTLENLIKNGLDDFYTGDIAQSIASDLENIGSPIKFQDLQSHQADFFEPVRLRIKNAELFSTSAPTQGLATLMILGQFARRPRNIAMTEDVDMVHWLVEATKQAFSARNLHVRDPELMATKSQSLLAPNLLDALTSVINKQQASPWGEATSPADTTWFGAIDSEGRSVSCIQSIYHEFGSGVVLPQTGLCWQNRGASFSLQPDHPLTLKPGTLPFHTLCPSIAHFDDGRRMVFGTMGGDGQPQTQAILFTRYADYQQPLDQVISSPRWVLGRTWGDPSDNLKLESRFDPQIVAELKRRGHDIVLLNDFDETVGHAGAIVRYPDGRLEGASDPRSDGAVCTAEQVDTL